MGLLIWTAYGVYAGQNIAIQTLAAKFLQLDLRVQLRDGLGKTIDARLGANQSTANFTASNFAEARSLRLPRLAFRASRSQPLDGHAHRFDRHHSLSVSQGFALQSQARRTIPPKRIRHPTGYAFASSCSPTRLRPRTAQIPPSPRVERRSYFPLHAVWLRAAGTRTPLTKRPRGSTIASLRWQ
jgi:hypothetical protein